MNHQDQLQDYNLVCLPFFMTFQVENFKQQNIHCDWSNKTKTFNFMINKPRLNREFLIFLIEHFQLENFAHTLAWKSLDFGRKFLKTHTNNALYHKIIDQHSIGILPTNFNVGSENHLERGIQMGQLGNAQIYQQLLQKNIFEPACVSLITEPAFFQRETIHTEKTIMAMYGGTIPIWIGGWKLAEYWKNLGFDVFEDIVDHSYQDLEDPFDRCYFAIERNLDLLRNFDLARMHIEKNQHRLQHNFQLLQKNIFLADCLKKINTFEESIQKEIKSDCPASFRSLLAKKGIL
jgi:hypothetical protein